MKFIDEYRDPEAAQRLARAIARITTRPWNIMEVCGGQTHAIVKFGLDELLPPKVSVLHGPGCPVCVTPMALIDAAIEIASRPGVIFCSFGDMVRVPGTKTDLLAAKAAGGDVRIVYSPLDAVKIAQDNPAREVVFFAVGFETTAPATAMAVYQARSQGLANFTILPAHMLILPAMEALLASPQSRVQAFLMAGHVCTVMGYAPYEPLSEKYRIPIVVTGFEPVDILQGIYMCLKQLEEGRAQVENQYARVVAREGNPVAQQLMWEVFEPENRTWRGLGEIPGSGLTLREKYCALDAGPRFGVRPASAEETSECQSGPILLGLKKPPECPEFGARCTPEHPLGALMVSSEGACAAYYRYRAG